MFARKNLAKNPIPTFRMLVTDLSIGTTIVTTSDVTARVHFYADMTPDRLVDRSSEPVQTGMIVADSTMNVEPLILQMTYPPLWAASPVPGLGRPLVDVVDAVEVMGVEAVVGVAAGIAVCLDTTADLPEQIANLSPHIS